MCLVIMAETSSDTDGGDTNTHRHKRTHARSQWRAFQLGVANYSKARS